MNTFPTHSPIITVPLCELHDFPRHPFSVQDDDAMAEMTESVKEYGVLSPILVRLRREGGYEIISGHRRKHACERAGITELPAVVRELDDDEAVIAMVDANLQREHVLPSEKAAAYKMKLDAIKRQGARTDLTCTQVGHKSDGEKSIERVAEESGESKTQVQRYIRLTELCPELQRMVDDGKIAMTPAVELSYLKPEEQALLLDTIDSEQATPSLSQAQRMKRMSREGTLDCDTMLCVMIEQKKPAWDRVTLGGEKLRKYFPAGYTPRQIEDTIYRLLDLWFKRRMKQAEQKRKTAN